MKVRLKFNKKEGFGIQVLSFNDQFCGIGLAQGWDE
jgi:hypothetical protein